MRLAVQSDALWLARIAAWSLATAITVLSIVPPYLRPETAVPHALEHFSIYLVAGFAFGLGYDRKRSVLVLFLVIFAGAVEIAQLFVPGRHARVSDFVIDALAVCAGPISLSLISQARPRIS